ncbi:MAG: discoidin domain-containing protein [Kutzneria sp.]|nr:discoidin domain-containing protein [Kutzneria sp.]
MHGLAVLGTVGIALTVVPGAPPAAAPDDGWVLSTTTVNTDYHPTFVGNGYLGARIPAAGNGWAAGAQFELAGLYATRAGATAVRPSLPAWSSLDVSDGSGGVSAALAANRVSGYLQSLDLRTGVVTTSARWTSPAGRTADIRYQVFADRARAHLGVVRVEITPHWSGTVTVTDQLDDRSRSGLSAPVVGGEPGAHQIWETTQANGNVTSVAITSRLDAAGGSVPTAGSGAGQRVTVDVSAGRVVAITKYVGIASSLDATDPLTTARTQAATAAGLGWDLVDTENRAAWNQLWQADIRIRGDEKLQRQVRASQFSLLASVRTGSPWAPSPAGLSSDGYNGHVFWDTETWMYPSLLAQHPDIANSVLQYRVNRIDAAMEYARSDGRAGLRFPWESALSGMEDTPMSASTGKYEQHISSDVALAVWQYWLATGDRLWLHDKGFPILRGVADFWVSRASANADGTWSIAGVTPPDEYHENVTDSVYTNVAAREALRFATSAAWLVGQRPDARWARLADGLRVPLDAATETHPEYAGYRGDKVKQADVVMLAYPWENDQPDSVTRGDMDYYVPRTDQDGPSMTDSIHSVVSSQLGDPGCAAFTYTKRSVDPFVRAPFDQFAETRTGGAFTFVTGAGGFLQEFLYGYSGLRWRADRVHLDPSLPPQLGGITLTRLQWRGRAFTVDISPDSTTVRSLSGLPLPVEVEATSTTVPPYGELTVPTRRPDLTPTDDLARCAPVTADSADPSEPAIAAVDGDPLTAWRSVAARSMLTVDLRGERMLHTLSVRWGDHKPGGWTVAVSEDGVSWTTAARPGLKDVVVDLSDRYARFVRVAVSGAGAELADLQIG